PLRDEHIAFEPGLQPVPDRRQRLLDMLGRDPAQLVDPRVDTVDEFLLFPQFDGFPV
ncbi:hypothetical protein G3M55_42060, partial [Streptomyces sp. SID8455]|nr:hypothetical protein [Streptomyces sp. SID8455]